jgi:hypothetical protein
MISRKHIAAALAGAGLAAAGVVVAADKPEEQGCASAQHASPGKSEHGMQRMREMHARMGGMHGSMHGQAEGGKKDAESPKTEEHKH